MTKRSKAQSGSTGTATRRAKERKTQMDWLFDSIQQCLEEGYLFTIVTRQVLLESGRDWLGGEASIWRILQALGTHPHLVAHDLLVSKLRATGQPEQYAFYNYRRKADGKEPSAEQIRSAIAEQEAEYDERDKKAA